MADEDDDDSGSVETEAPPPMGVAGWVVTYGDMMSLLLCFFILLFIFAKDEENKYMDALASIKEAFGVQTKRPQDRFVAYSPSKEQKTEDVIKEAETDLYSTMQQVVSDVVRTDPDLRQSLRVEMEETGVKLTVLNDKLFYPGTAYLHPRNGRQLLRPVLEASHRNNFNIIVRNNSTQSAPVTSPRCGKCPGPGRGRRYTPCCRPAASPPAASEAWVWATAPRFFLKTPPMPRPITGRSSYFTFRGRKSGNHAASRPQARNQKNL